MVAWKLSGEGFSTAVKEVRLSWLSVIFTCHLWATTEALRLLTKSKQYFATLLRTHYNETFCAYRLLVCTLKLCPVKKFRVDSSFKIIGKDVGYEDR